MSDNYHDYVGREIERGYGQERFCERCREGLGDDNYDGDGDLCRECREKEQP